MPPPNSREPRIDRLATKAIPGREDRPGLPGNAGLALELGIGRRSMLRSAAVLACGALHEIAAARETEIASATSLCGLAVTTRLLSQSCRFANGHSSGCPAERWAPQIEQCFGLPTISRFLKMVSPMGPVSMR